MNIMEDPSQEYTESFWSEGKEFNQNTRWLQGIQNKYYFCIKPNALSIKGETLETLIPKLQDRKGLLV